jgi:hypothetical protein
LGKGIKALKNSKAILNALRKAKFVIGTNEARWFMGVKDGGCHFN